VFAVHRLFRYQRPRGESNLPALGAEEDALHLAERFEPGRDETEPIEEVADIDERALEVVWPDPGDGLAHALVVFDQVGDPAEPLLAELLIDPGTEARDLVGGPPESILFRHGPGRGSAAQVAAFSRNQATVRAIPSAKATRGS
jgi:hypothetical protein